MSGGIFATVRRALIQVAVAAFAVQAAAPAGAQTPTGPGPALAVRTAGDIEQGPDLAGERLFYGELRRSGTVMRLTVPGAAPLTLATVRSEFRSSDDFGFSLATTGSAASAQRLALSHLESSGSLKDPTAGTTILTLLSGAPGGPLAQAFRCTAGPSEPAFANVDVDAARVVSTDCNGAAAIRDYGGGGEPAVVPLDLDARAIGGVRLAGNLLAYARLDSSPGKLVVYDWVARKQLYEVPRPEGSFDLASDGTLVTSAASSPNGGCSNGKLAWHSPADPAEHVLAVNPCRPEIEFHQGRISVVLEAARGERVLALVGLDGSRADVARLGAQGILRSAPDYDGARVAYGLRNCTGGTDLLTDSATAPRPRAERTTCPLRIRTRAASIGPTEKTILLGIGCAVGCAGRAVVEARSAGGSLRTIGSRAVRVVPEDCPEEVIRVPLSSAARKQIRRSGTLSARTTITTTDRNGKQRVTRRKLRLTAAGKNRTAEPAGCAA